MALGFSGSGFQTLFFGRFGFSRMIIFERNQFLDFLGPGFSSGFGLKNGYFKEGS
jgi:hypothetical protein